MSDKPFLDTNILIYVIGEHDERTSKAEALLADGGIVSVQVLNELVAVARRKLAMSWEDIDQALEAILVLCPSPVPLSLTTHQAALRLARRYEFQIYDALIVAAALEAGSLTLYSEDLQAGQTIDRRLTIRNPFQSEPRRAR